jgi:hypothetical protein
LVKVFSLSPYARRFVSLLVVVSLFFSSGGYIICVRADGSAALEVGNRLIGCADRCGLEDLSENQLTSGESSKCVDLLIPALPTIRSDQAEANGVLAAPQEAFGLPSVATVNHSWVCTRRLARPRPPNSQELATIRSTILLI